VADTYLRYAIELAFLAEQAYEFEADKRINVIRFDYDQSEGGAYLAADFLMRDLDTLEQDLLVTQDRQEPLPASCKRNRDKERSRSACRGRPDSQICQVRRWRN
jgi:hypothetical protein